MLEAQDFLDEVIVVAGVTRGDRRPGYCRVGRAGFCSPGRMLPLPRHVLLVLALVLAFVLLAAAPLLRAQNPPAPGPAASTAPQSASAGEAEFKRLVALIIERRTSGGERGEGTAAEEQSALGILDAFVLDALNAADDPKLEVLNQRLAMLVTQQPPVGEGYAVLRLDGSPPAFALAANFGSSGPSAARFYLRGPEKYRLAARIDPVAQPDYFDDYLEIVPISKSAQDAGMVFVTVTGRTDEFATGVFAAWRLTRDRLEELWVTDLLPRSSYAVGSNGFQLTYCAEPDEDRPGVCQRMTRERYIWDGAWKRVEQTDVPISPR